MTARLFIERDDTRVIDSKMKMSERKYWTQHNKDCEKRLRFSQEGFLKPCPFCGSEAELTWTHTKTENVQCTRCEAEGPHSYPSSPDKAAARWNERAK